MLTTQELIILLQGHNPDSVVHLSVDDWDFAPITGVAHEPTDDGPGCTLLHIASRSAISEYLTGEQ